MQEILERLRQYATAPPDGMPPQILPWDRGDPWGLYGAARAALGLLLDGKSVSSQCCGADFPVCRSDRLESLPHTPFPQLIEKIRKGLSFPEGPGDRLFAVADYLLTFCSEGYGPPMYTDALLLNGTALALCGYLCNGAHPEADLWRITGCARLATEVHNRKAALDDRVAADCLSVVCQVADETDLPILADLVTLRERMWGRLLDHSRTERLHVAEAEYPSHMANPVPVDQVGELMAERDWQRQVHSPDMMPADLQDADGTCNNLITLRTHMLVRHQFGTEVDWNLRLFDDKESTVSLCAQPFIRNLARADGRHHAAH